MWFETLTGFPEESPEQVRRNITVHGTELLGNADGHLWEMRNGYALATEDGLLEVTERLRAASEVERDALRELLRIGSQWNTQVTLDDAGHTVTQTYCSALPVAYSHHASSLWADFARLVLEAAYEATFCAAIINARQTGNRSLYLTFLGGGAFGNKTDWIVGAIKRAIALYKDHGLDVAIVSYGRSSAAVQPFIGHA